MEAIHISGREFKPVTDSTLEHDIWTVQQLDRAGLRNMVMGEDETPDVFANRMMNALMMSGAVFELLGGLLMPAGVKGKDWTPDMAAETGRLFAAATGPDKALIKAQLAGVVEVFLAQGLLSLTRSQRYSARTVNPQAIASTAAQTDTADGQH
jgi:hypothetical protein